MIGRLRGVLIQKQAPYLLLDVHGVGYEVAAPMSTFYQLPSPGQEVTLHTHLIIREDLHALYGFATEQERVLFRTLIKVSGVGAKLALTILSGISVEAFVQCVHLQDGDSLARLPGIGKKTAQRLIVEMRDRLGQAAEGGGADAPPSTATVGAHPSPAEEALNALTALGYKPQEATRLLGGVDSAGLDSEELIRRALQAAVK
ncbi:MAG TPA: Holliday junction branch migration protein RuvA [Gammaproteobacteria bacterium]|nr:Holliday junction branch migration protein RuvA [Gammaproteobacteria bacterium]